jgi:hypothetical protein
MIPVPSSAVSKKLINDEPSKSYRRLLNLELQFCRKNEDAILRKANRVHRDVVIRKDSVLVKSCCNFTALETACDEYQKHLLDEDFKPERLESQLS